MRPSVYSATATALRPGAYTTGIPSADAAVTSTLAAGSFRQQASRRSRGAASSTAAGTCSYSTTSRSTSPSRAASCFRRELLPGDAVARAGRRPGHRFEPRELGSVEARGHEHAQTAAASARNSSRSASYARR